MKRSREGISTYLQTFILISVAMGGSALALPAIASYSSLATGPSLTLSGATIRQGPQMAIERMTVTNSGTSTLTSLAIVNPGVPATAYFCYSTWNPSSGTETSSSCPSLAQNPSLVKVVQSIPPAGSLTVVLTIVGASVFSPGSSYLLVVSAVPAAQASSSVVVVPG